MAAKKDKKEDNQEVKAIEGDVVEKVDDEGAEDEMDSLTDKQKVDLTDQVKAEYKASKDFMEPKIKEWLKRLKLYNNQKRDKKAVGDPLIFTIMNSLLASMYDDRMTIAWEGRERGDLEVEEHLNVLSEYDYDLMMKANLDYDWLWDVLFFGYGLVNMTEFDRDRKVPVPELIDPAAFLYDPKAMSVDGNSRGIGGMRFCGREILLTKYQMEEQGVYKNIGSVRETASKDDLTQEAARRRQEAIGGQSESETVLPDFKGNNYHRLIEWRTWFDGGRVLATFTDDFKNVVRYQPFDKEEKTWQIVDKAIWRMAHQFQGVSVPDLVEDKQRKRSVVTNLGVKVLQADLYPMYVYDTNSIQNKADLIFGFNKFVPSSGPVQQAVQPMNKVNPNMQLYDYMMGLMDSSAQRATATPELQQGVISKEARTLGELNLVAQKVDTRYSLAVKNLMTGEKKFWSQWYRLYKKHFKKEIDKKVLRLSGVMSGEFRELTRENIIMKEDPDVKVESKILSEARKMKDLSRHIQVLEMSGGLEGVNMRYGLKSVARLSGMERDEVDVLYPPTLDEMMAREQNDALDKNENVPVLPEDDHTVHLEIHAEAADTDATYAHIETHKKALLLQREQPDLFPQLQEQKAQEAGEAPTPGGLPAEQLPGQSPVLREERPLPRPSQEAEQEVAMNR